MAGIWRRDLLFLSFNPNLSSTSIPFSDFHVRVFLLDVASNHKHKRLAKKAKNQERMSEKGRGKSFFRQFPKC